MRYLVPTTLSTLLILACGGSKEPAAQAPEAHESSGAESTDSEAPEGTGAAAQTAGDAVEGNEFKLGKSDSAKDAHGMSESKIKPTSKEAAMKFIVEDKDKGPMKGIVIAMTAPDGKKYYTQETDMAGYAEVLVPVGQTYNLEYLSLGRSEITAKVPVANEPNQNVKLTLRYKRIDPPPVPKDVPAPAPNTFVLEGIEFDTGKATIRPDSLSRFYSVLEYMTHKKSARLEISGHTDNVGSPKSNKKLSENRAKACRDYLISQGIEGERITAVGYGQERPIASNDSDEGRQQNRRIEATEL